MKHIESAVRDLATWRAQRHVTALDAVAPIFDWLQAQLAAQAHEVAAETLAVLQLLDGLRADGETLAAAALHTLIEHGLEPPSSLLPLSIAVLIEGQRHAAKVWSLHAQAGTDGARGNAEGLRRLLLAIVRDLRVVLILLARQLVRMRSAAGLPQTRQRQLAQLTADIHAPLANRLGVWQLKWELEDLAFRYLQPDTYRRIAQLLDEKRTAREAFIEAVKRRLRQALDEAGIRAEVAGRPKHIFSIWKKLQRKDVPFSELYDVRAVRIMVDDITHCYAALGLVHGLWTPLPTEFDDYIAKPKGNGYRSLHTAVIGPEGRTLEVQIRSFDMHEHAELGVAAHWRYKEGRTASAESEFERKITWMRQLLEGKEGNDDTSLLAGLSTELIEDRVYVLTPQGQVIDLPLGGTVLDFAYHVHTEVGHRCRGAKVNGRIVPLTFQLNSGDQVEILTGKLAEPRRDWLQPVLGYLASSRARDKVRAWFHRLDHARNVQAGRELLDKELKRLALHQRDLAPLLTRFKLGKPEELYLALALGDISPSQVCRTLHELAQQQIVETDPAAGAIALANPPKPARGFTVEGVGNLMVQLARCCQPVAGDVIKGYLTQGRGVSVHRDGCRSLAALTARHPERVLPVEWGRQGEQSYKAEVLVRAFDRKSLLKDLTNVISAGNAHILAMNSRVEAAQGWAELRFTLKVNDYGQLGELLSRLAAIPGVSEARRTP